MLSILYYTGDGAGDTLVDGCPLVLDNSVVDVTYLLLGFYAEA